MKEYKKNSHWLNEALNNNDLETPLLVGDTKADICIIGGGFTGLWTAIHLKEDDPSLDIVIIEKDTCGAGPSGRNGGFVLSWWGKFLTLEKLCGGEEAVRLAKASADAVSKIGKFCSENNINAGFRQDGWLWAATNTAQIDSWEPTLTAAEKYQEYPFERWTPEQVINRSGSERHIAGVYENIPASVQPAKLARGLRRVALEKGVRIYEQTPLTRLVKNKPPKVHTPKGIITAQKVVLAINAWSIGFRELRKSLVVVSSDIVATAPIPDKLAEIGYDDGLTISDSRMLVHYYRTTLDGRLAFGKGGMNGLTPYGGNLGKMLDGPSSLRDNVSDWLKWTYPNLGNVKIDTSWTGPIDRSKNGLPFFGNLGGREDIIYGAGYSGNGVGPTYIGGRIIASLALGKHDEWSRCALVRELGRDFPPEPIRYFGGKIVRNAVAKKDKAEDEGQNPGRFTKFLASFAPAGLSPFKGQTAGIKK
jgi:putative aminophosphonate oxidoreductase